MPTDAPLVTGDIIKSLRNVSVLEQLNADTLQRIAALCTTVELSRGERLIAEGETADTFFIVLHGRFVVLSGNAEIAEITTNEPIGEMAFFSGGTRSATVIATCRSQVLVLTRDAYVSLVRDVPELPSSIIRALALRISAANTRPSKLYPRAGKSIGLFPAADRPLDPRFVAELSQAISNIPHWYIVREQDVPGGQLSTNWIMSQESANKCLVLLCDDPKGQPEWARQVEETAEINFIVADTSGATPEQSPVSQLERHIYETSLPSNTHLVLLRAAKDVPICNSAAWLADRPAGLHHHVALGSADDIARLTRFIMGQATGIVFCGGGAFGTAHLGMVKALLERGYSFDMVGGTSMGAAIAGAFAMGHSADRVMDICDDMFVRSRTMKRLTAPVHSILEHRYFDAQLKRHYEDYDIADLPLNFYAIATSLTHSDLSIRRQGPLWKAVRASTAIPGIFPPMLGPDGEVLVDGALIDNAPLETMRAFKPGINIVMNFTRSQVWTVRSDYDLVPGRWGALRKMLFGKGIRFPTMFSVLTRSMVVNAERKIAMTDPRQDVILEMPNLQGMGFLDWTKGRRQFEAAYQNMSAALESASADAEKTGFDLLRSAAQQLSKGRETAWGRK